MCDRHCGRVPLQLIGRWHLSSLWMASRGVVKQSSTSPSRPHFSSSFLHFLFVVSLFSLLWLGSSEAWTLGTVANLKPRLAKSWKAVKHKSKTWLHRQEIVKPEIPDGTIFTNDVPSAGLWQETLDGIGKAERLTRAGAEDAGWVATTRRQKVNALKAWFKKVKGVTSKLLRTTKISWRKASKKAIADIKATSSGDRQQPIDAQKQDENLNNQHDEQPLASFEDPQAAAPRGASHVRKVATDPKLQQVSEHKGTKATPAMSGQLEQPRWGPATGAQNPRRPIEHSLNQRLVAAHDNLVRIQEALHRDGTAFRFYLGPGETDSKPFTDWVEKYLDGLEVPSDGRMSLPDPVLLKDPQSLKQRLEARIKSLQHGLKLKLEYDSLMQAVVASLPEDHYLRALLLQSGQQWETPSGETRIPQDIEIYLQRELQMWADLPQERRRMFKAAIQDAVDNRRKEPNDLIHPQRTVHDLVEQQFRRDEQDLALQAAAHERLERVTKILSRVQQALGSSEQKTREDEPAFLL